MDHTRVFQPGGGPKPGSWAGGCGTMVPGGGYSGPAPHELMTTLDAIEPEGYHVAADALGMTAAFQPTAWQGPASHGTQQHHAPMPNPAMGFPMQGTDDLSTTLDMLDHTTAHLDSLVIGQLNRPTGHVATPQALGGTLVVPPTGQGFDALPDDLNCTSAFPLKPVGVNPGTRGSYAGQGPSQPQSMPPPPPPPTAEALVFAQAMPKPMPQACASTAGVFKGGCPNDAKLRDAWIMESVLEIFSASTGSWKVAHVICVATAAAGPDVLTLQFYADDGAKNKALYRNDHQLAPLGVNTAGVLPPGCQMVPSQSRPGQSAFLDTLTGSKYETAEQVWKIHFERLAQADAAAAPPALQSLNGLHPTMSFPMEAPATATFWGLPQVGVAAPKKDGGKVPLPTFLQQAASVSQLVSALQQPMAAPTPLVSYGTAAAPARVSYSQPIQKGITTWDPAVAVGGPNWQTLQEPSLPQQKGMAKDGLNLAAQLMGKQAASFGKISQVEQAASFSKISLGGMNPALTKFGLVN